MRKVALGLVALLAITGCTTTEKDISIGTGAGAIIGGAVSQPRPVYRAPRMSNAHVQWCYNRYKSYRSSDNTFQPYNGPRRQCYSPYSR